jgi:diguanylate cyclase (GGDEF)-like protein
MPAPTARPFGEAFARMEPMLRLAGVEPQLASLSERLRRILIQVEELLPGARVRLLHLESATDAELGNGPVRILRQQELQTAPHYREALRQNAAQFATTAPPGAAPGQGEVAAALPLRPGGVPWGILEVTWPPGEAAAVRAQAPLLSAVARLVDLAIQNQTTLEKLVFIDPLTGVYNRAFYERQAALEMERAHRTGRKFALLVLDVDDFKAINDRHGHRAGDQVLARLAHEVLERMRKIDLIFRYGGEEFVLLLPGAEQREARRTAERLRSVVNGVRFAVEGLPQPLHVTVSIGLAIYPDDARTASGLFKHADAMLYRAKEQGKNRVVFQ